MPNPMPADAVLDRYFLEMRSKVLELGADLDRIDEAEYAPRTRHDNRLEKLREAIATLTDDRGERTARIQMLFSDGYESDWPRPKPGG